MPADYSHPTYSHPAPSHLVIPFSVCNGDGWLQAMKALPERREGGLTNLPRLLRGMKLVDTTSFEASSLSTPHERVLAKALGLPGCEAMPDGLLPWAAWQAAQTPGLQDQPGKAWAFITPCHWAMGREHASLSDPAALALTDVDAQTLLQAMQPYFETEGITLHPAAPDRWLAEGEIFRDLPTASIDRVMGRNVDAWLPAARKIKLLQNEMQMLLYTHPWNDERSAKRRQTVNSFWLSGTGALVQTPATCMPTPGVTLNRSLAPAAFTDDWAGHAQAWAALDAGDVAALLARQAAGESVRLSLCSESQALTFETSAPGLLTKIMHLLRPHGNLDVLFQLSKQ
ncbi:MAG: hypothetical protein EAZ34_07190 [Polaromonas sp.]|nr:MAG: hypothetical protein EAZ34_07190 [Polaromonas sp.]